MTVMHRSVRLVALAAAILSPVALAGAQNVVGRNDSISTWRGALPAHAQLTIRNFNGPIDVRPASGNTAEFRGVKRTRGSGSIQDIGFAVENGSNGDVSICASLRQSNPCDRDGCPVRSVVDLVAELVDGLLQFEQGDELIAR